MKIFPSTKQVFIKKKSQKISYFLCSVIMFSTGSSSHFNPKKDEFKLGLDLANWVFLKHVDRAGSGRV